MSRKHDYPYVALISVIVEGAGLSYGIVQPGEDGTGDMGVLRPVDFENGRISDSKIKYIDRTIGKSYQRTELTGKEILISVRGTTGITAISDNKYKGMNVTRGIAVIRYDETKINPIYLNSYLRSEKSQQYIQEHTKGIALKQINIADLKELPVMLPPIEIQQMIAAFMQQTDKSKFELTQALEALNATYKKLISENLG